MGYIGLRLALLPGTADAVLAMQWNTLIDYLTSGVTICPRSQTEPIITNLRDEFHLNRHHSGPISSDRIEVFGNYDLNLPQTQTLWAPWDHRNKVRLEMMKAQRMLNVSEASRSRRHRRGWGLYFVSLAEANAEEPIDHQGEGKDSEDGQEDRAAQESGKDLLLAEEERACGDKKSKAHAPEVTRDALSAGDSASSEHTDVSRGGKQEDYAEEEAHASRCVFVRMVERLDTKGDHGGCSTEAHE